MKGLILRNGYSCIPQYEHQISRMHEELSASGVDVEIRRNGIFDSSIDAGRTTCPEGFDFCLFLDKDQYTSRMMEKTGIILFNSAEAIEICDDKMLTYIALSDRGIRMPDTTPGPLFYDPSIPTDRNSFDILEKRYGYPMIVKESFGSMGRFVHRIDDRDELEINLDNLRGKKYLVQEFIGSSIGEDLRVIVVGGRTVGGMLRRSGNDFRSNAALGATASAATVPPISAGIAEEIAGILGLDYCGIDLLKDENGEYTIVCEVNSNAFFASFEESTGINVARIYAEHIVSKVRSSSVQRCPHANMIRNTSRYHDRRTPDPPR